jgi:hypothetical protein
MTNKNAILILAAIIIVAVMLSDAGCVGAMRYITSRSTSTPTPAPEPSPLPTAAATATSTPRPTAPVHVDLIYTRPLEAGANNTTAIHVITGSIVYNGDPVNGYAVIVDTVDGCEYGNKTNAKGEFQVAFRDDGSPTYVMKVANTLNLVLYTDKTPRPLMRRARSTSG